jgi:hypothetical protein
MDHRWPRAAVLILIAATGPALPLREAEWTVADKRAEALTRRPVECVTQPQGSAALTKTVIGRAAFHTPTLLGGQAARVGMSCASCHVNGRGNPHFVFPGLSGAPGTADVTSSIMSKKRGDGMLNPKPIPDLVVDPAKVSRDPASPALRDFIRGLVVDEFDGPEPTAATLEGLTAYVRALSPAACKATDVVPVTLQAELSLAMDASEAALNVWTNEDSETARFLIAAARASLGRIHERYAGADLTRERKAIERLDKSLGAIQSSIDRGSNSVDRKISAWQMMLARESVGLKSSVARSLFAAQRVS